MGLPFASRIGGLNSTSHSSFLQTALRIVGSSCMVIRYLVFIPPEQRRACSCWWDDSPRAWAMLYFFAGVRRMEGIRARCYRNQQTMFEQKIRQSFLPGLEAPALPNTPFFLLNAGCGF